VPHPTDESDANTLPDPELNPLLNPLLAAHMGRWAEVYFTNPPEKRGQAISELLRELENISPPEPAPVQVIPDEHNERGRTKTEPGPPEPSPAKAEPLRTCKVCAYNNAPRQKFCGMCGAPLQVSPETHVPQVTEAGALSAPSWLERSLGGNSVEDAIEPAVNSTTAGGHHKVPDYDAAEPAWPLPARDLPSFSAESGRVESGPVRHRYRLYAGAVLAILLAGFVYMAWRGSEALSSGATRPSAPARAVASAQPPAPAASAQQAGTMGSGLPASVPPAPRIVPVAGSSPASAGEPGGAEELAIAEKFLNGKQGVPRDSGEAAQWLWKAVRKRNLAATMALSDLYLRGDGVPKSCDQARYLLEAAARRGGKAAAERLSNLQISGCE
jgi:hypothetical protein